MYVEHLFRRSDNADASYIFKRPEFYVLYNGKEPYSREITLKLSDAFIEPVEHPDLELIVKVVNINRHNEHPLLALCNPINEYSIFVQTVRKWKAIDPIQGFQKAVEECIAHNILREYLERKTKEVINMLLAEYNYEEDIAVQRAEEREIAFAEGIEQGFAVESARILKQLHCDTAMIIQVTGLSKEEIEAIG